jgi:hypothetical protein
VIAYVSAAYTAATGSGAVALVAANTIQTSSASVAINNVTTTTITPKIYDSITTATYTPLTGATPVTIADLKKSFLTLYEGDLQLIYNIPMLSFNNFAQNATTSAAYVFQLPQVDGITISWVKSYISLPSALATTGTTYSFGVYYHF